MFENLIWLFAKLSLYEDVEAYRVSDVVDPNFSTNQLTSGGDRQRFTQQEGSLGIHFC
jgi:hypothetical protein